MELDPKLEKLLEEIITEIPQWIRQSTEFIVELRMIADSIDESHKSATIANIAGTSTGAVGGILSIAGLVASPFTMGGSLVLTAVGMTAGVAGGVTNITATVCDTIKQNEKQKRVNEIVQKYQTQSKVLTDKLTLLNNAVESLIKTETKHMPEAVFVGTAQGIVNSLSCISTITSKLTKSSLIALKSVSGILAGLTLVWDVISIAKDAKDLGKETEISQMIRQIAKNMQEERNNFEQAMPRLKECLELNKNQFV